MSGKITSVPVPAHYEALCAEALEAARETGEPEWMLTLRREAACALQRTGFPTLRAEEWKYTDIRSVLEAHPALPRASARDGRPAVLPDLGAGILLVVCNGVYLPELSRVPAECGLEVHTLDAAVRNGQAEVLRTLLPGILAECPSPFVALHAALLSGGLSLRVPRGQRLTAPVNVVQFALGGGGAIMVSPRLVVQMERESEMTLVHWHAGQDGRPAVGNSVTDILLGEGAQLQAVTVQAVPPESVHFACTRVTQAAASRASLVDVSFGGRLARHELVTRLDGEGASAELFGLYAVRQSQHVDYHTVVDHRVPNGTTRQIYKGLVAGESRAVFSGKIIVRPGARQTDAYQLNKNLLLDPGAVVDTKPQLEIANDDVKCTHGATIGQLDRGQAFYLQSRGIERRDAEALLARGFAAEILDRVPAPGARLALNKMLQAYFDATGSHSP